MSTVRILSGLYRTHEVIDQTFPVVKGPQQGARGWYITVQSSGFFGADHDVVRIKFNSPEDIIMNAYAAQASAAAPAESDAEVMIRINKRFEVLDHMTVGAINGSIRAMIVTGPPGVGKSFGVEHQLERHCIASSLSGNAKRRVKYDIIKGALTPLGLYQVLYKNSDPNCVLVFDDADNIFFDDISLNLLKAALDTSERRRISWNAESRVLAENGIPSQFDFKGSVIFITNLQFANIRSKRLQDHLAALESRCHFVDLTINTPREKMLRIRSVVAAGAMLDRYGFSDTERADLAEFIEENSARFREISLRLVIKLADLMSCFGSKWKEMARVTCML